MAGGSSLYWYAVCFFASACWGLIYPVQPGTDHFCLPKLLAVEAPLATRSTRHITIRTSAPFSTYCMVIFYVYSTFSCMLFYYVYYVYVYVYPDTLRHVCLPVC